MSESERDLTPLLQIPLKEEEPNSDAPPVSQSRTVASNSLSYNEVTPYTYSDLSTEFPITSAEGEALQSQLGIDHFVGNPDDDRRLILMMNRRVELTHAKVEEVMRGVNPLQKLTSFAHTVPNPFKKQKKTE